MSKNFQDQIVVRKIEELKKADYNPRKLTTKQRQDLTNSIKKFGLVDPILINTHPRRKDIVIGGHQRLDVAEELGYTEVPCIELSLTLKKERELNIRLNKNTGQWDLQILQANFQAEELLDFGFEPFEFNFEQAGGLLEEPDIDEDRVAGAMDVFLKNTIKQIGLYYQNDQYEKVIRQLDAIATKEGTENNSDTVLALIDFYERNSDNPEQEQEDTI